MATSGNYTLTVNKQTIIEDALIEAGVIRDDQTVDGTMYSWMERRLNQLIKHLQVKGLQLWVMKEFTLLLEEGKIEYTLGPGGDRASETVVRTQTSAIVAIAGTTYTIDSSTGMTVGDVVGIEMGDGEMHWDTIAAIPDSTSITVNTGPTVAVASDATVYAYTSLIPKPLRIYDAYVIQKDNEASHQPINIIPREEYMRLNSKSSEGVVVEVFFNPERTTSSLKVWPTSSDNIQRVVMTGQMPFETLDISTDELAMPDWWQQPIHLSLAHIAARSYRAPVDKTRELRAEALLAVAEAENFDVEETYIEMVPDVTWIK